MYVVPSFSFFGCLVGFVDAVFSLLFSFSQALGNPNPLAGFGVPLVFILPGHALQLQSARLAPHLHQGHRPAPVFFFSFLAARVVRFLVVVGFFLFGGCCFSCIACKMYNAQSLIWREGDNHLPPSLS